MSKSLVNRRSLLIGSGAILVAQPAVAEEWWQKVLKGVLNGDGKNTTIGDIGRSSALSNADIVRGLKEALNVSSDRVIQRVGRRDGYLKDNLIHIPLPDKLQTAQNLMSKVRMSGMLDDLEVRLNRAAETAAPYAKNIFVNSITSMTINDAKGILTGPDDSATRYFEGRMTPQLQTTFRPIIKTQLDNAGAFQSLQNAANQYSSIPLAGNVDSFAKDKLIEHGLDYALGGIFHYLAKEEKAIRNNPAKRTTEILRKVFG